MYFWSNIPAAFKVPLLVAGFMMVVGLIASQMVVRGLVTTQEREFQRLASLEIEYLSSTATPFLLRDDVWEMFSLFDNATRRNVGPSPTLVTLVGRDGTTIVSSNPTLFPIGKKSADQDMTHSGARESRRVMESDIRHQDMLLAKMIVEFDTGDMLEERRATTSLLLFGNALATLLLALIGYVLVQSHMRPIGYLLRSMGAATGRFEPIPAERIPTGESEISKLYRTYNALLAALEERKIAERRLAERERFVSLGRLSGTIAHEINNPLGGMLNAVDTIKTYRSQPSIVLESAHLLERGLIQMRDVVRSTLDLYRDGGAQTPLSLDDLEDIRLLIRPETARLEQQLDWHVEAPETVLRPYPSGKVRQIALNLLLNACQASGVGGRVGFFASVSPGGLSMAFTDSGPGLLPELRQRLLEDQPVEPGGGLGLRMVRELVVSLNGRIGTRMAESGLHEISIVLPLRPGGDTDAE